MPASGAIKITNGKAIAQATSQAPIHRDKNPSDIPVFIRVIMPEIISDMMQDI